MKTISNMEENTRRITPTAFLVLPSDAKRERWLQARRDGITATDLPKILGMSDYGTAIDVWQDKLGLANDDFETGIGENEAAFWGITFEDVLAREWAKHNNVSVRRIGIIAHTDQPWMRATLDRLVSGCPDGRCALEVKTRSVYVAKDWQEKPPADVVAQVDWQALVSGLDHTHVIGLIGGQRLVQHVVPAPTEKRRAELIEAAHIVWESVGSGEAPKLPEALWTEDYLDQLHTDRGGEVEIPLATAELVQEYNDLLMVLKDLEADKAEMRTRLIGQLGEAEIGTLAGKTVYSYKASKTRRFDQKALAELYPDVSTDERVWNTTTTRSLRTSQKKETK